ncbi:MAG TPA: hypothetical protein VGF13_00470 [Verrucomicrobiae bacterium]
MPVLIDGTVRVRSVAEANGLESELSGVRFLKLAAELTDYTASLPIMVIENFGAGTIPQKGWNGTGAGIKQTPRHDAAWVMIERSAGVSAFTNAPQMFSRIGIRGRGAFSSTWRQKPYSVEALKENGDERSISPLGLPAHPDWVPYFPDPDANKDPAMLFNTFAYELYQHFGRDFAVRFRWVEQPGGCGVHQFHQHHDQPARAHRSVGHSDCAMGSRALLPRRHAVGAVTAFQSSIL